MADHRDDFIIAIRYALLKKGAKQKFSLFFLILLSIAIITLDKISLPLMTPARAVLNDIVYHVLIFSNSNEYFLSTHASDINLFLEFNWNPKCIQKVDKSFSNFLRLVFLYDMTTVVNNNHFIFAHHVSLSKFHVHSVRCCK